MFTKNLKVGASAALLFLTVGCQEQGGPAASFTNPSSSQNSQEKSPGGVIDSSGGNALTSSVKEVDRALDQLSFRLSRAFYRLKLYVEDQRSASIDWPSKGRFETFSAEEMQALGRAIEVLIPTDSSLPSVLDFLKAPGFKIERKASGSCDAVNGHSDASANPKTNTICFSIERLKKIPPGFLAIETTLLGLHEVAHLMGLGEEEATMLQRFAASLQRLQFLLIPRGDQIQGLEIYLRLFEDSERVFAGFDSFMSNQSDPKFLAETRSFAFQLGSLRSRVESAKRWSSGRLIPRSIQDFLSALHLSMIAVDAAMINGLELSVEDFDGLPTASPFIRLPEAQRALQKTRALALRHIAGFEISDEILEQDLSKLSALDFVDLNDPMETSATE
jgi:hypothetical protein